MDDGIRIAIDDLYNGKQGLKMKYFFYLYYPLHVYALVIAARLLVSYKEGDMPSFSFYLDFSYLLYFYGGIMNLIR